MLVNLVLFYLHLIKKNQRPLTIMFNKCVLDLVF